MAWGKVDDKLHSSVKWRRATKSARALWTTSLSWCSDQGNGGHVPEDMLRVLDGTPADAKCLVRVGLWEITDGGWCFHDWTEHNPDAATVKASRQAKSAGGGEGNHKRWHARRGLKVAGCRWCEASDNRSVSDRSSESVPNPPGSESSRTRTRPNKGSDRGTGRTESDDDTAPELETSTPRHLLPTSWTPTTAHKAAAIERGINLEHEVRQFRSHHRARRTALLDWDAEFDKWLGNARGPSGSVRRLTTDDRVRDGLELAQRLAAEHPPTDRPQIGA